MPVTVAVPKERAPGERRVALVPEVVAKLAKSGVTVQVETGAGTAAFYPDEEYTKAGAQLVPDHAKLLGAADLLLVVQPPSPAEVALLHPGAVVVGFLNPSRNLDTVRQLQSKGLSAFAIELLPRITRAQSMDALSSQASAAGYVATLLAAEACPRFLPMLTTAAGTIRPAKVLILGAGVAGLMAIATAKRLGGVVEAYDVRRAAGEQVRSLGAKFLELAINAEGSGGYARELTPEEKAKEQAMVATALAQADIVITTANVPGRKAPRLIGRELVATMKPGSVIVDLAAESGGNCEATKPGERLVEHGVTIWGPLNLPSQVAFHASQMYARNLQAFLGLLLTADGVLVPKFEDEILVASLLVTNGEVRHAPTKELLQAAPA
ncbi:MAG: Re/Si-specific NAD(P)(+) transhydrogenase subunit alpha [Thermoplasmata archaeon]|nr:Re/Si-specific NAD(P)(+) transhydrogenase subunit alpha [Thermoplasmata archaeon]